MLSRPAIFGFLLLCPALAVQPLKATVIFSDNFNRFDGPLDSPPGPGELGGVLGSTVVMRSQSIEQTIVAVNTLAITSQGGNSTGSVRFDIAGSAYGPQPANGLYDFASGPAGADILASGGMVVSFTWTPFHTSANWIAYDMGVTAPAWDQQYPMTLPGTDSGIVLLENGQTQFLSNGSYTGTTTGYNYASGGVAPHQVSLEYLFNSFADGTPVQLIASVDGNTVGVENFHWNGTGGQIFQQLDTNASELVSGELINNFQITTAPPVPEPSGLAAMACIGTALLGRPRQNNRKPAAC